MQIGTVEKGQCQSYTHTHTHSYTHIYTYSQHWVKFNEPPTHNSPRRCYIPPILSYILHPIYSTIVYNIICVSSIYYWDIYPQFPYTG